MAKKSNSFKNILMLLVVLLLTGAQVGAEAPMPCTLPGSNAGESPVSCKYEHESINQNKR